LRGIGKFYIIFLIFTWSTRNVFIFWIFKTSNTSKDIYWFLDKLLFEHIMVSYLFQTNYSTSIYKKIHHLQKCFLGCCLKITKCLLCLARRLMSVFNSCTKNNSLNLAQNVYFRKDKNCWIFRFLPSFLPFWVFLLIL